MFFNNEMQFWHLQKSSTFDEQQMRREVESKGNHVTSPYSIRAHRLPFSQFELQLKPVRCVERSPRTEISLGPVSYTHLDVYKRQEYEE